MENNIDIFVTAFKSFKECVTNNIYKIIGVKDYTYKGKLESYKDNVGDNISDMNGFFNELTAYYWLAKNYPLKKYIGVCSYRRYFEFLDDIPPIEEIFNDYDIILPKKESVGIDCSVFDHYSQYHNQQDIILTMNILQNIYPQYIKTANKVINDNFLYANNMFIMKREDFIKYCEFVFNILFEYLNINKLNNYYDVLKYVYNNRDKYLKTYNDFVLTKSISYNARIGGFLAERLLTIFVFHNFKKVYEVPMIFTPNNDILKTEGENTLHFDEIDKIICPSYEYKVNNIILDSKICLPPHYECRE